MENSPRNLIIMQKAFVTKTAEPIDLRNSKHKFYFEQLFEVFAPVDVSVVPLKRNNSTETCSSIAQVLFTNEEDAVRAFEVLKNSGILKNGSYQLSLTSSSYFHINDLPNELLIKILSKLPMKDKLTIEKVCTRWENLAEAYWVNEKKFYVSSVNPKMAREEFLQYITRCGSYCEDIQIYLGDPYQLSLALEKCVNLNSLRVEANARVPEDSCHILSRLNQYKIKRVMMQNSSHQPYYSFALLLEQMSEETTEIHVNDGNVVFFDVLRPETSADFSKFKNLRALTLSGDDLTGKNFSGFEQLTNLVCLDLSASVLDIEILEAIKNFTKLEHLALYESNITDDILISISQNNKNLEFLNISYSSCITERSIISLSQHERLRVLFVLAPEYNIFKNVWGFRNLRVLCCELVSLPKEDWIRVIQNSVNLKVLAMTDEDRLLQPKFEKIARRTLKGETLIPEIPCPGIYLWIEDNALREKLQPFFSSLFSYFRSWITEDISWYSHEFIRVFD